MSQTTVEQNVREDKMENKYEGNIHCKDAIGRSNSPTPRCCCCCLYCSQFGDVAATTENCVKIISPTKLVTQN